MTFWPEKFFADTAHIPGDAANCYLALIGHAWIRGGSLPNDEDALRLMCRCHPKRWGHIKHHIMGFWHVGEDGRLHQKRIDEEWKRADHKHRGAAQDDHRRGIIKSRFGISSNGKKTRKIKENSDSLARPRDPTPTPSSSLLKEKEEEGGNRGVKNGDSAAATLSVLDAHASPPLKLDLSTRKERAERAAEMAKAVANACAFPDDDPRTNVMDLRR